MPQGALRDDQCEQVLEPADFLVPGLPGEGMVDLEDIGVMENPPMIPEGDEDIAQSPLGEVLLVEQLHDLRPVLRQKHRECQALQVRPLLDALLGEVTIESFG